MVKKSCPFLHSDSLYKNRADKGMQGIYELKWFVVNIVSLPIKADIIQGGWRIHTGSGSYLV